MKARVGFNQKGGALAWRCYGTFQGSNKQDACIGSDGSLTNKDRVINLIKINSNAVGMDSCFLFQNVMDVSL